MGGLGAVAAVPVSFSALTPAMDPITSLIAIAAGDATALAATRGIRAKWVRRIAFVLLACGFVWLFT